MTQFYSRVDTTLNGDVYSIPFSYIKEEEIQVYIGDELYTDWYFLNDSQIKINNLPSDLPSNTIVSVRRLTDISKKEVEYTNNTLLNKENLNLSQDQLLHAVQEIYDNNIQFEIDTLKVIQENKEEILDTVQENKEEVLGIQQAFEDEVNHKIQEVSEAASKINALEEAVDTAIAAANTATEQASIATDTTQEIIAASEELKDAIDKTVEEINDKITNFDTSLEEKTVELTQEADRQINNIQSTGFYMRDDKLYFINSKGEEEEFKSGGAGAVMFDTKIADHILEGEEALGWALQGTYVSAALYPDFYNKCLEEKMAGLESQVTLGESVLTMFVNNNGHQFYDIANKSVVDTFFDTYGIADFYGVDEENERIFLPRNKYFHQLTLNTNEVNNFVEAGLPNIEAKFNQYRFPLSGGAITYANGVHADSINGGSSVFNKYETTFNASESNSIYGNSDTVQPPSSLKLLYYCVGNTEVTQAITNVTEVTTSENDTIPLFTGMYFDFKPNNVSWLKAGRQQNNAGIYKTCYDTLVEIVNGVNKYDLKVINQADMVSGVIYDEYWVLDQDNLTFRTPLLKGDENLPSNKYQEMELKASGETYIAPANGWFSLNRTTTSTNQFVVLTNMTSGASTSSVYPTAGTSANVNIECKKGDVVKVLYTAGSANSFGFIYAQGKGSLYFKVANAVQNLELLEAGEVLEGLANVIPDNSELIASYNKPSYKYINLEYGADETIYTAPANGYFAIGIRLAAGGGNTYLVLIDDSGNQIMRVGCQQETSSTPYHCFILPVAKNQKMLLDHGTNNTVTYFRFVYDQSSESEVQ